MLTTLWRPEFVRVRKPGKLSQCPWARFTNDFCRNSNSIETSPCCNSVAGHQIATNFCTCHDSTAVVPCTKLCSGHCIRIEMRVKRNFHGIWIAMEKPLVKRGPDWWWPGYMFRQDISNHAVGIKDDRVLVKMQQPCKQTVAIGTAPVRADITPHNKGLSCFVIVTQGPVSLTVFPSQFKFDGNFVSLSSQF